jgi:hypothetical protein
MLFIVWDALVYFGPSADDAKKTDIRAIAKSYFKTDIIGLAVLAAAEALRFVNTNIEAVVLIVFIVFAAWLIYTLYRELTGKRFTSGLGRTMLR